MQSMPSDMYEATNIDGATPLQQFWHFSLPQLAGILAALFRLRFHRDRAGLGAVPLVRLLAGGRSHGGQR